MAKETTGTGNGKTKKCCRGWWWKLPLTLLVFLVVIVVVVYVRLGPIATSVANSQLPKILNTGAFVERIDVNLRKGLAEIHGLRIEQPEGFGDGAFVILGRVMAKIDLGSIGGGDLITIETIEMDGIEAHIVKNKDGVLNVTRLGPPPSDSPDAPATVSEAETVSNEAGAEEDKDPFPGIRINTVAIQGVVLSFADESTGEHPLEVALGDLGIAITNCEVRLGDDIATTLQSGNVTLQDISVSQPAGERPIDIALADLGIDINGCEVLLGDSIGATLQDGRVTLNDISVSQPSGFGDDMLVQLPMLQLDVGTQPFEANVVRIERLALDGLRAHIIRDTNGVMNVMRLTGGGDAAEGSESAATEVVVVETPEEDASSAGSPIGVYLGELALTDFQVVYADSALADEPMTFTVNDIGLNVRDLMAFLSDAPVATSSVDLSLALDQGDYPPALLDVQAALGPVSAGVPDVNAQVVFSGFMVDTIGPLVPAGVREAAGADGADMHGSVALNAESVDFEGRVATDAGHVYPIMVKGPLSKPAVDLGPIAFAIAGRLAGGVMNLTEGAAGAALDLTKGATAAATDLGEGAADVAEKIGGGLFGAAKAAMKLDLKGIGNEVGGTVTGVAAEATETASTATGSATEHMGNSVDNVKGGKRTAEWLEDVPTRHDEAVAAAAVALPEMPFPPPVVSAPAGKE